MRVSRRAGLTGALSLAAVAVAAACLAIPAAGSAQQPPLRTSLADSLPVPASKPAPVSAPLPASAPASAAALPSAAARVSASAPASAAARGRRVVALGDSYTAGALLPLDLTTSVPGCLRSPKAYPVLVAAALGAPLTDAACESAGVSDLTTAERTSLGMNPPQLDALAADDGLVLLTLGGDDIGFSHVLDECMQLSFTDPWGSPCEAHYTSGGTDKLAALIKAEGPRLAAGLAAIAARAPRARIIVVGYPDLFPLSGGCWPRVPITDGDISYLRGLESKLNAMAARDAAAAGASYVDTYTPTIGHDFCQPESVRDVEGLVPGSFALPFHPNARGQAAIAAAVLKAL